MSRKSLRPMCPGAHRTVSSRLPSGSGLRLESLERRDLMAALTVDIGDSGCAAAGDDMYCQIQEAIDAATEGDVIQVASGTYEPIVIAKNNLTIEPTSGSEPTIDATDQGVGVSVRGSHNVIRGLIVENSPEYGFSIRSANGNTLEGNTARGNSQDGFSMVNSDDNTLVGNMALKNAWAGFVMTSYLMENGTWKHFGSSDNNVLERNTAQGNSMSGFQVEHGSSGNTIRENWSWKNGGGFFMSTTNSSNNVFEANIAQENYLQNGFKVWQATNNVFEGNIVLDNAENGFRFERGSRDNTIRNNLVSGNGGSAFSTENSRSQTFDNNYCVENGRDASRGIECAVPLAGDANLDGQFNQLDIVDVLQANRYLSDERAVWSQGDWNFDGRFDQGDIIAALQTGSYLA